MSGDLTVLSVGDVPAADGLADADDRLRTVTAPDVAAARDRSVAPGAAVVDAAGLSAAVEAFDVPVVAATNAPEPALEAGADDWLPTDAPPALVAHRVRAVVDGRPPADTRCADRDGDGTATEPVARQLRTIVDNLPMVLFALDADGAFTLSEGRGLAKLGLEPGEVVGEYVHDVYADNEALIASVERALDGEHVNEVLEVGDIAFETWYQPVFAGDDGDEVRSVIGAAIDVTEQVERERELEQYETIVETVPDGVFVIDEEGNIVGGNERGTEMLGYAFDELMGDPFHRLVEDGVVDYSLVEEYLDIVRDLLSDESDAEQAKYEFEMHPLDGGTRHVEGHLALRPHDGEFRGTIGINRDITDRKERERQLRRQNERLAEFASVVSHDLRNPLNVAQGTTEVLAEEVDHEELSTLRHSLDRMADLVEDLLELARTGQTVTGPEPVALASVAEDAWASVAADATLAVETDAVVEADRSRLRQLLENLFRNAVEHAGPGVRVEVGDLAAERGFSVTDDGPGVPAGERDQVFEYGYSTAEDGTGFGLAIVRSIAEAHGWSVSVGESDPGGARFEFSGVDLH